MAAEKQTITVQATGGYSMQLVNVTPFDAKNVINMRVVPDGSVNGANANFKLYGFAGDNVDVNTSIGVSLMQVTIPLQTVEASIAAENVYNHLGLEYNPGAETLGSFDVEITYKSA